MTDQERRTPGPDSPEWAKACATLYDVFLPSPEPTEDEGQEDAEGTEEGEAA